MEGEPNRNETGAIHAVECSMVPWFIVSHDSVNQQKHYKKPLHQAKPIISEHQNKWKCNAAIADQCKQRGTVSHRIGEWPWRSSSQPTLFISFEKHWKPTFENQIRTVRKTNTHRTWWRKSTDERACLYTR